MLCAMSALSILWQTLADKMRLSVHAALVAVISTVLACNNAFHPNIVKAFRIHHSHSKVDASTVIFFSFHGDLGTRLAPTGPHFHHFLSKVLLSK
jgi:uncharacterized protein involved in outer membrane biogenesis